MTPIQGTLLSAHLVRLITVRPPSLGSGHCGPLTSNREAKVSSKPPVGRFWGSYLVPLGGGSGLDGYPTFYKIVGVVHRTKGTTSIGWRGPIPKMRLHTYAIPKNSGVRCEGVGDPLFTSLSSNHAHPGPF